MERVDLKVGFYCNNQCVFCVQGRKRDSLPAKDILEIKSSLEEAFLKGKREVVLTGGEPTLHPDFFDIVKIAKKIGFAVIQIQSNGRLFAYEDFCAKAVLAGANQFSPSLHGADAKTHDFLTQAQGSFEQTKKGIKNLKKLKQYVLTNSVITSKNFKRLPQLAKLLVSLGVDQFQFAFVHILGTARQNQSWLVPKKTEVMPFVKKALQIGLDAGRRVTTEAIPYCFLQGYEDCVGERIIPATRIYDAGFTVEDYGKYRFDSGKERGPKCPACKYFGQCEGPWKEYIEIFGWDEFTPIKK